MQPWTKKKKKMFNRLKQVMDKCAWYALILKKLREKVYMKVIKAAHYGCTLGSLCLFYFKKF